ncbi:hypothetical protein EXW53_04850 [Bacillus mycoides]|nr:hypothetical protein EXW53_04850 [Bacillus mycoides]
MNRVFAARNLIANLSNRRSYTYSIQKFNETFQYYEDEGIEIRAYFEPLREKFSFFNKLS